MNVLFTGFATDSNWPYVGRNEAHVSFHTPMDSWGGTGNRYFWDHGDLRKQDGNQADGKNGTDGPMCFRCNHHHIRWRQGIDKSPSVGIYSKAGIHWDKYVKGKGCGKTIYEGKAGVGGHVGMWFDGTARWFVGKMADPRYSHHSNGLYDNHNKKTAKQCNGQRTGSSNGLRWHIDMPDYNSHS